MRTERGVLQSLIRYMKPRGFELLGVNDGEETVKTSNEKDALDTVFSVDESWMIFRKQGFTRHSVYVVLGNSPEEVVADWGYKEGDPDGWDKAMEAWYDTVDRQ